MDKWADEEFDCRVCGNWLDCNCGDNNSSSNSDNFDDSTHQENTGEEKLERKTKNSN